MEKTETQEVSQNKPQNEVANDVAMLFSWAKMENTPYRDFSRPRKASPAPQPAPVQSVEPAAANTNGSRDAIASSATVAAAVPAPPLVGVVNHPPAALASEPIPPVAQPVTIQSAFVQVSPVVAIYSVAGGVGKTALCANLGKALCSLGEQPLLVDVSSRGLLPFYFGATDQRAGSRKFVAPGVNAPFVQVVTADRVTNDWLEGEVKPQMASAQRTVFDLGELCGDLLPTIFSMCTMVLIPLLPDLNSVVTVAAIESSLNTPATGPKPAVYYVFNRFDEHKVNDQHARDLVARQCGQRLLPITLRHDLKLTEALHGPLATADHTPGPELSHDYLELALWVRRVAPLRSAALLTGRWSEQ
jgi:cellulose biosynthesis protein BcsQ